MKNEQDSNNMSKAVDTGKRVVINNNFSKSVKRRPAKVEIEKKTTPVLESAKPKIEDTVEEKPIEIAKSKPKFEPLIIDDSGDFASLLQEMESQETPISINVGDKVTGKIISIGSEYAFLALGSKLEGAIDIADLKDKEGKINYNIGDKLSLYVLSLNNGITLSNKMANKEVDMAMLEDAKAKKIPIDGKIAALNKGGFEVMISGKKAFCPIGQVDDKFVDDPNIFIGKTFSFLIEKIEEGGRNIVLSRRALLEKNKREDAASILIDLEEGKRYNAVITKVADFGAFADIGGIQGLIPRSEISYGHFDKVSDVLSPYDKVEVIVIGCEKNLEDPVKTKLSLSIKRIQPDPYALYFEKIKPGVTLEGKVVRLENFGAFVEIFKGIDGLIHISELSENRVAHPKEILSIGDPVTVRVLEADAQTKKIALSLREAVSRKKGENLDKKTIERGQKVSGVVSRIERYGVFLSLTSGQTALLPASETGLPRETDLARSFKIGDSLEVLIIEVDEQNRIRVSLLARQQAEERERFNLFQAKENASFGGLGTFADLLNKKNQK